MLPNNSTAGDFNMSEPNNQLLSTFEKVTEFIGWSHLEHQTLEKFERMLCLELQMSSQELASLLETLKIDHELSRNLIRMAEEIQRNLQLFFENPQAYLYQPESKSLGKVSLLIKNSSQQVKTICESLMFLHFASRNMGSYNKIIHFFDRKALSKKIQKWSHAISLIFKHKIYSVITILYIQSNHIISHHNIILSAICERQKYLHWKWNQAKSQSKEQKKRCISLIFQRRLMNMPLVEQATEKQKYDRRNYLYYQVITIFFRYKLIDGLASNQKKYLLQELTTCKGTSTSMEAEKHAWLLTLIHRFISEVNQKNLALELPTQIQFFNTKMKYFLQQCENSNKIIDQNLCKEYEKIDTGVNQVGKKFNQSKIKVFTDEQSIINKPRSLSQSNISQKLNDLFFKSNEKRFTSDKNKSKSAKAWMRDRSKSKIMAKILANTFQNAKNALRQIQFQIKTSNVDELSASKLDRKKSNLVKKKKQKVKIYQQLNKNKKIVESVCKNSLIQQIIAIEKMQIFNQFDIIQENKKCIIDHKVIHKDTQQSEGLDLNLRFHSTQQIHSQVQSRIEFVKLMEGIPTIFNIRIKPKDKNYILKIGFSPPKEQQINIQISLPKSNNIFTGRYQTIWPTIKYLLRKKLLQHPLLKEHESKIFQNRPNLPMEERNHESIKQDNLLSMFGPIDEEQFAQISATLSLICKFVDIMLYSQAQPQGRRYSLCQFHYEKQISLLNEFRHFTSISTRRNTNQFLAFIKENLRMINKNHISIGTSIIKQRVVELNHFNRSLQKSFYIFQISSPISNFQKLLKGENQLLFTLRVLRVASEKEKGGVNFKNKNSNFNLFEEQIRLCSNKILKYQISLSDYMESVRKIMQGTKFSRTLQFKIMQVCWLHFNKKQSFYAPSFFNYQYKQITQPRTYQVSSSNILFHISTPNLEVQQPKIKTYENILEFKLEQISFVSNKSQHKNSKPALQGASRNCTGLTHLHLNQENRVPSINTAVTKKCFRSLQFDNFRRSNLEKKQNILKCSQLKLGNKVKPVLAEIKFLTPFSLAYNWIAEIKLIHFLNNKIDKIIISAHDLSKLGYQKCQTSKQTLQSIQQLTASIKISNSALIPKLVIQLNSCDRGNISIEANYQKFRNQTYDADFDQGKSVKNTVKLKYRSIIFDKRNYKHQQYQDKPYFQMSGSVIESRPTGLLDVNNQRRTHKKLTLNFFQKVQAEQFEKTRLKKSKAFLINLVEFEEYLSTVPYKLKITNGDQRLEYTNLYTLMSIKRITLEKNSSLFQKSKALIEIQINFSQSQYSLVSQIHEQDLRLMCLNLFECITSCTKNFNIECEQKSQTQIKRICTKFNNSNEKLQYFQNSLQRLPKLKNQRSGKLKRASSKQRIANLKRQLFLLSIAQSDNFVSKTYLAIQTCSTCQGMLPSRYNIKIKSATIPMKIRLYHEYELNGGHVVDVYLHSQNFAIKTGVNSGVGLGAQIQIAKIGENDHLQLVYIRMGPQQKQKQRLDDWQKNTQNREYRGINLKRHSENLSNKNRDSEESLAQKQIVVEQVSNAKILDLIKKYKLEHMQADHYSKNTILLTEIAKYLVKTQSSARHRHN